MRAPVAFGVLAIALVAWLAIGLACVRTVRVPVPITPAACLTERAPRPPADAAPFGPRWLGYYRDLVTWAVAAELACGPEEWRR